MSFKDIKAKHGGRDGRSILNRAVRAEIPGGAHLLDAREAMQPESQRPRHDRPPAQIRAIREVARALDSVLDILRKAIIETYGGAAGDGDEAQKETRPATVAPSESAARQGRVGGFNPRPREGGDFPHMAATMFQSTPSQATPEKIPAPVAPVKIKVEHHANGAIIWTAEMDALLDLGLTDDKVGAILGTSRENVRRRREYLKVPATRRKVAWTAARLAILRAEPDNARAAALLETNVNSVKIARSRLKP